MKSAVLRWLPSEVSPTRSGTSTRSDEPLVRGHAELADRLLVPAVARLREGTPEVDGVREVEAGGAVVHQVDVGPDVVAQPLAEVGVGACVAPGVELDRRIAELEALVGDVEELLDRREGRRRRVRGDLIAVGAEQTVNGHAQDPALEIPERDVDDDRRARSGTPRCGRAPTVDARAIRGGRRARRRAPRAARGRRCQRASGRSTRGRPRPPRRPRS